MLINWSKFAINLDNHFLLNRSIFENIGSEALLRVVEEAGSDYDDSCQIIASIYDETNYILSTAPRMSGVGEA